MVLVEVGKIITKRNLIKTLKRTNKYLQKPMILLEKATAPILTYPIVLIYLSDIHYSWDMETTNYLILDF